MNREKIINSINIFFILFFLVNPDRLVGQEIKNIPVFVFGTDTTGSPRLFTFSGRILDEKTNENIPGAVIQLIGTTYNTVSDDKGYFQLKIVSGNHRLKISYLGYENFEAQLKVYQDANKEFKLTEQLINLQEVTINQKQQNENVTLSISGVEQLSIKKIEEKSQFLGEVDVLRSLQSLSGVSSAGEGASGFNVQGGNTDENLILQDGNLIINPVHALGFFSLFHPDMVRDITLYKGDVPAKYGGRLSSILDIKLREGNDKEYSAKGGIGIAASRLSVEGPIKKNKASFILGARASYFDWILKRVNNLDLRKSNAFFYDLTGKVDARLTKTTKIGISAMSSADDFQFADEVKFDYQTVTGTFYIRQLIGDKINLQFQLNKGAYKSALFDIEGNNQSHFQNQIQYLRSSFSIFWQLSARSLIEAGVEQNRYKVLPGSVLPLNENSIIKSKFLDKENGIENAVFIQNQVKIKNNVEFTIGLRITGYQNLGQELVYLYSEGVPKTKATIVDSLLFQKNNKIKSYVGIEPRFSFRYSINDNNSIKFGFNRSYQYLSQISNTASATPIDLWQVSNYYIRPQQAANFSLGYYRNDRDNTIQSRISLYYRHLDRIIEYKDFAELLLNESIETELLEGKGKAYGIEFSINKNYGKHRFEGNYTYSRSLRQVIASATQPGINNDQWYPSNFDKPHIINWNYNYRPREKRNLSVNFTYSTGRPTTAPVSSYINSNILNIPIYSNRNEYRIPDFHRLDFAYTIGPWGKKKNRENSLTFSVYNLYGRKNAFSVYFRQLAFQKLTAYRVAVLGTIFPAITYNFKF